MNRLRVANETLDGHVIVVGGGPAGLSAAIELRRAGVDRVTVVERERELGGIPRHTDHLGFGIRDQHRILSGPGYARRLRSAAERAGVQSRTATTVVHISGSGVELADGSTVAADAVVLATGVRERPRSARLIPGDRPAGVYNTGTVQQLTTLYGLPVGRRAVIVGAEHVSFSAIWSLRHAGCTPVAMVTSLPRHQSTPLLRHATATRHRVPLLTGVEIAAIEGRGRVSAVVLTDGRRLSCDTVVFTGDWVPDHELAYRAGLAITQGARSPAVTAGFATSVPGVFAAGNLVHPAEAADMCALDGRAAARSVAAWLNHGELRPGVWPADVRPIEVEPPITWASFDAGGLTLRVGEFCTARVQVSMNGQVVTTSRTRRLVPNRAIVVRRDLERSAEHQAVLRVRLIDLRPVDLRLVDGLDRTRSLRSDGRRFSSSAEP